MNKRIMLSIGFAAAVTGVAVCAKDIQKDLRAKIKTSQETVKLTPGLDTKGYENIEKRINSKSYGMGIPADVKRLLEWQRAIDSLHWDGKAKEFYLFGLKNAENNLKKLK